MVIDHWIVGILCPGLRFDLKGAAPAAVAAGSGVSFNYIFGKYIYTSPNNVQHPWFGVSLFAQGAVNVSPGSVASTTETAAVGAGIIILNYVVFGWIVDLLAGRRERPVRDSRGADVAGQYWAGGAYVDSAALTTPRITPHAHHVHEPTREVFTSGQSHACQKASAGPSVASSYRPSPHAGRCARRSKTCRCA